MMIDSKLLTDYSRILQGKKELCISNRWVISLCVDDNRFNQNFRSELQERYTLSEAKNNKINGEEVDLYIIDISLFEKNREHLIDLKRAHDTEIYPVMVLISDDTDINEYPDVWDIADEIVSYPANIEFIYSRIELLLRYRKMFRSLTKSKLKLESTKKELRNEKEFLFYVADNMPGIFFMLNTELKFKYWNKAFAEYLGYTDKEISAMSVFDLFEAKEKSSLQQKMVEISGKGRAEFSSKLINKIGEKRDYLITGSSILRNGKEMIIGSGMDITDQLEAQFASNQQKHLMDAIIDQSNSIISVKDENGTLKLANQAFLDLFELAKGDVLGRNVNNLLDPKLISQISQNDSLVREENGAIEFEEELGVNGKARHFQTLKYPLKNVPGLENHICGISTDITVRKNLFADLQQINNRKKCLLEISKISEQYCTIDQILSHSVENIPEGFKHSEYCHAKIKFGEKIFYSEDFCDSETLYESNIQYIEDTPFQITVFLTGKDEELSIASFLNEEEELINDIAQLLNKKLERLAYLQKLQESEQRWQNLVENDPDLIVIVQKGIIRFLNKAGADMYGTTPDELIGKNLFDVIKLDELDLASQRIKLVEQGKTVEPQIYRVEHPMTKDIRYLRMQSVPVVFNGVNSIQIVGTDLTDQINSENKLKKSFEEKKVLLQEVHHRVKNNLAVVSGLMQLQLMNINNNEVKNILNASVSRIKSMALIHEKIYQQQSLSHIDFKEYLNDLISNILESMDFAEKIDLHMDVDHIWLNLNQAVPCALILNEIITNSVKHAFKNTENPKIKISLSQKENRIYIKIHDNGVGFPTNFLDDSSSMGVTILRTLCQQLEANLHSENNNGACIRFDFESKTIKGSTSNLVTV